MNKELYSNWFGLLSYEPKEVQKLLEEGLEAQKRFYAMRDTGIKAATSYPDAFKFNK